MRNEFGFRKAEVVSTEALFRYEEDDSEASLGVSVATWQRFLKSWGVSTSKLHKSAIREYLSAHGRGTRPQEDLPIANGAEVRAALARWGPMYAALWSKSSMWAARSA